MADDGDENVFIILPNSFCEKFLVQVFKKLDQRHQYSVLPLVCRLWHQLQLQASTSLGIGLRTPAQTAQLSAWLQKHGANLHHVSLFITSRLIEHHVLMQPLTNIPGALEAACTNLRSLCLREWPQAGMLPMLSSLTQLTRVKLQQCHSIVTLAPSLYASFPSSLQSLSLTACGMLCSANFSISAALGHLPQLTSLHFTDTTLQLNEVAALHNLSGLKEVTLHVVDYKALQHIPGLPCTTLQVCSNVNRGTPESPYHIYIVLVSSLEWYAC
jgi:hypothetical protein